MGSYPYLRPRFTVFATAPPAYSALIFQIHDLPYVPVLIVIAYIKIYHYLIILWDGICQTAKATGATNPRVLIVTVQVSYLPQGMQKIIDYLVVKDGGLADVFTFATFKNFTRMSHDFIRQDLHKIISAYESDKSSIKRGDPKMLVLKNQKADQRTDERFVSNLPIIFSFFSSRFWHEYTSMTLNHSKDGMCFESSHPLAPGTNLFIRIDKKSNSDSEIKQGVLLRTSTLAAVKWCRELSDGQRTCYFVGVRYY